MIESTEGDQQLRQQLEGILKSQRDLPKRWLVKLRERGILQSDDNTHQFPDSFFDDAVHHVVEGIGGSDYSGIKSFANQHFHVREVLERELDDQIDQAIMALSDVLQTKVAESSHKEVIQSSMAEIMGIVRGVYRLG